MSGARDPLGIVPGALGAGTVVLEFRQAVLERDQMRAERDKALAELRGVMEAIDKWLDDPADLAANPATRAAAAREVALRDIDEQRAILREFVAVCRAFLDKFDECVASASYRGMVEMAHLHGWRHKGPDWVAELKKFRSALQEASCYA